MASQTMQNAQLFRSLHTPGTPLLLSNVWDVASAVIAESVGAPAIATTSAGVAWALGSPDGNRLEPARAIAAIAAIAAAVTVPVTADIEGGGADTPAGVANTVAALIDAGVVGINIEDGTRSPEDFAQRVSAARQAADGAGVPLFINARTDVYLAGLVAPEMRLEATLTRAQRYVDAGADGIFVPGTADTETIRSLTAGIRVPVNIMVGPGSLDVHTLASLAVARISLGSSVAQAAYGLARRATAELLTTGTYESVSDGLDYGELNGLLARTTKVM